ncbi:DmsE family decaheme c-type cytochrome [Dissulfurirhabdus thermomarina]|uniref:DmsE family decaheme c-type cytochrome n=1 Tax=Dissulfurirhabdus thermomarina TaxID=1765737 RepID=A0A6N9TNQ1_DISTH|nr:GSU2203 family decaheme c-type cytochrome [Dissulfurirhabdus thermomarina]NDY42922.1 DmsE family decaheme c-type cytochrome [Dissulfurirhabdus thermomarina]NMX23423.1 DmsE family decaheme c-type cytochrome [Dissulfurirhabdus thermomarina]
MIKRLLVPAAGLVLLIGCAQMLGKRADYIKAPSVAPGAAYVGSEACLECHEGYAHDRNNVHMRIAAFEVPGGYKTGCEGCHGPGSAHVEGGGDTEKILRFTEGGLEAEEVAGVCTTCHQVGPHMNWAGSAHAENGVACTACHRVHLNGNKRLLAKKQLDLCAGCHQDVNAQGYFASHHPLKEGKMVCTSCHNPHGTANTVPGMLNTDERVNDLCLDCHTRYQGPFVFEHDPVVEDCLICHDPHGTVANNLLRQQEPFLCLTCHEAHFHAARASNDVATVIAPGDPANTIGPTDHGFQKSFMTKCTQCHSQVHGSDLPSQTVPGGGHGLTR